MKYVFSLSTACSDAYGQCWTFSVLWAMAWILDTHPLGVIGQDLIHQYAAHLMPAAYGCHLSHAVSLSWSMGCACPAQCHACLGAAVWLSPAPQLLLFLASSAPSLTMEVCKNVHAVWKLATLQRQPYLPALCHAMPCLMASPALTSGTEPYWLDHSSPTLASV